MRLLDLRSFELKSSVHEVFDHVWKSLVNVDIETRSIAIYSSIAGKFMQCTQSASSNNNADEPVNLYDAVTGLKSYKEVDERMEQLWRNVDAAIVSPRMNADKETLPGIRVEGEVLRLTGQADRSVEALLSDLATILVFLAEKLPSDLLHSLCSFMMVDIIPRLIHTWLDSAVPSSLVEMDSFQAMILKAKEFCETLDKHGYTGLKELKAWVGDAPSIWLDKCRETTLDSVRSKLCNGIGQPKQVEKVEKQMVSIAEGKKLSKTPAAGAGKDNNDWGADWGDAWDVDEPEVPAELRSQKGSEPKEPSVPGDDDGADAWGWDDDNAENTEEPVGEAPRKDNEDEDDVGAAWGWGDDDAPGSTPEPSPRKPRTRRSTARSETRELVLRETYNVSSMPEPLLELIYAILLDAATLTKEETEYAPVAVTAPGLFSLPTFALALFRAISPYYYSLSEGGNM